LFPEGKGEKAPPAEGVHQFQKPRLGFLTRTRGDLKNAKKTMRVKEKAENKAFTSTRKAETRKECDRQFGQRYSTFPLRFEEKKPREITRNVSSEDPGWEINGLTLAGRGTAKCVEKVGDHKAAGRASPRLSGLPATVCPKDAG